MTSVFAVYLEHYLGGFGDANSTHGIPIEYQISLLIAYLFLSIIFFFKTSLALSSFTIALFILTLLCSYSFTFSSSTNAIITNIGPITISDAPLSENLIIERKWYGYLISNESSDDQLSYLFSRITPLLFYRDKTERYIEGLGDCIVKKNNQCMKRDIAWP
jgi:hypothetical protein